MQSDPITAAFATVLDRPCWNVQRGFGTFLMFEFGQPRLDVSEPKELPLRLSPKTVIRAPRRVVTLRGEWRLLVYMCEWSIALDGRRLAHTYSSGERVDRALVAIEGQALTNVAWDPSRGTSLFEFDLGAVLRTRPEQHAMPDAEPATQWHLYEPSGTVLSYRADGHYSHRPENTPPAAEQWRPLLVRPER